MAEQNQNQTTPETNPNTAAQQDVQVTSSNGNTQVSIQNPNAGIESVDPSAHQQLSQQEEKADATASTADVQSTIQNAMQAESDLKADLQTKGVDFNALAQEYDQTGELSADSLSKLEKAGYPKTVVDAYLNGLNANAEKFASTVQGFAGGAEGYAQLGQFIKSQGEGVRKAFNAVIQSGDLGQIQLAIGGLKAQMEKTYGTANKTIMAGGAGAASVTGYQNTAEMIKDMSDPRYQTDTKFTQQVIQKIKSSSIF